MESKLNIKGKKIRFKCGDLITLKSDKILRTVRYERNGQVCADWIDEDGKPYRILTDKNNVILFNNKSSR
jgi:hypothetical protein